MDLLRDGLDSSPASTSYLDHLVSLNLDDLLHEPNLIASETSTVEAELTNLCYREYSTFTSAYKCSAAVQSAFDDFGSNLHDLLDAAPALEDECRAFSRKTSSVQAARNRVTLVLEHQNKLAELLELPQLMETCVRNGFYQEAMDMAAHVQTLASRHPNALINDVAHEVEGVLQTMMTQLMALLREPIKLPTLVKAIDFLRRLCDSEDDLGLAFLQSRLYNYRSQLVQIERDRENPVRYIRRYIDLFREHVYDIISQYSAIFDISTHLVSFASQCLDELVGVIATHISRVDDATSLSSILVQLGYCSLSFARVGLDFALLTTDHVLLAVEAAYAQAVASATTELAMRLKSSSKAPISEDSISQYPSLATFLNSHLEALNALRLLAPIESQRRLIAVQHASLTAASTALVQYFEHTLIPETPSEPTSPRSQLLRRNTETQFTPEIRAAKRREARRGCVRIARIWTDEVVPTLLRGLAEGVYGGSLAGETMAAFDTSKVEDWLSAHEERPPAHNGGPRTPPTSPGSGFRLQSPPRGQQGEAQVDTAEPSTNGITQVADESPTTAVSSGGTDTVKDPTGT